MKKIDVTFGIVNCNRLEYLKICVESLIFCTDDYDSKEIIIIDNASIEEGTLEYLEQKEAQGIRVIRQEKRDPSNEFAKALNILCKEAKGDFIAPVQGDMQFLVKGSWLKEYVNFFRKYEDYIGCILFDAQRQIRINSSSPFGLLEESIMNKDFRFYVDTKRPPLHGAADCMYSKKVLEKIFPWSEKNDSHEGGGDSETKMLEKISKMLESGEIGPNLFTLVPQIPVSAGIYTDPRGTNARVRGNIRYGKYWPPKEDFRYYEIFEYSEVIESKNTSGGAPFSIEKMAIPIGWDQPIDNQGNWLKNPIDPLNCEKTDYVALGDTSEYEKAKEKNPEHIQDWLEE